MTEKLEFLRGVLMKQARGGGRLEEGLSPIKTEKVVALVSAHWEIIHCACQDPSVLQSIPLEFFLSSLHVGEHSVEF